MGNPLILLMGQGGAWQRELKARLPSAVEFRALGYDQAPGSGRPLAACVEVSASDDQGLRAITRLRDSCATGAVVAVASEKDPDLILRAMRAGAGEFHLQTDLDGLSATLRRLAAPAKAPGTVIVTYGARGGIGSTFVACNLAAEMARDERHKVALVDADLELGDVLLFLDLDSRFGPVDLHSNLQRIDEELLRSSLPRHTSGLWAVAQPSGGDSGRPSPEAIPATIRALRPYFQYLVVDGMRGFEERTRVVIEEADQVALIITQELHSLRNGLLRLQWLRRHGVGDDRVKLVVNRAQKRHAPVDRDGVEEFMGIPVAATLSNDYPLASRCLQEGSAVREVAPGSALAHDFSALAAVFGVHEVARGGWLRDLFGHHAGKSPADTSPGGPDGIP